MNLAWRVVTILKWLVLLVVVWFVLWVVWVWNGGHGIWPFG